MIKKIERAFTHSWKLSPINFYGFLFGFVHLLINCLVMSFTLVTFSAPLEELLHYVWAVLC